MAQAAVSQVIQEAITDKGLGVDNRQLSIEALTLLINTERLHQLEKKSLKELADLRHRQEQVRQLHDLLKTINKLTENDELHCAGHADLLNKMAQAQADLGVEIELEKMHYNKEERLRLVENIKMTVDALNVQNDMQLQTVTRLTNDRYESYQMARSILKPLQDDKQNKARAIAGR